MTRLNVLVVDDDRDAAGSTGDLPARAGCRVRVCSDGPAALRAAAVPPDVCVLDLTTPGMTGAELAGSIRGRADRPVRLVAPPGGGTSRPAAGRTTPGSSGTWSGRPGPTPRSRP